MKEHYVNGLNNFIGGWYFDDTLLDEVIDWFDVNPNVCQSHMQYVAPDGTLQPMVDLALRDTLETALDGSEELHARYHKHLSLVMMQYIEKYPYCNNGGAWTITEITKVQKCNPGKAYNVVHCERSNAGIPYVFRHLVFMTYLNTVEDGGETEFIHQGIKVKPERGLTLVWPADWTFSHRGLPAPTEDKYIITGWFSYV